MGKCLVTNNDIDEAITTPDCTLFFQEFGTDLTPKYNMANDTLDKIKRIIVQPRSLRSLHSIQKRELLVETPQRIGGSIEQAYLEEIIQDINATHFHVSKYQ